MALKLSKSAFEEAKSLVESGDTDLGKLRGLYQRVTGQPTKLDDNALAVASMTEDDDDDERIARMKQLELEGYEITA